MISACVFSEDNYLKLGLSHLLVDYFYSKGNDIIINEDICNLSQKNIIINHNKFSLTPPGYCQNMQAANNNFFFSIYDDSCNGLNVARCISESACWHSKASVDEILTILDTTINRSAVEEKKPCPCCQRDELFSQHELKLLKYMKRGYNTNQLCFLLAVNEKSISRHKRIVMSKLGIKNHAQFVSWVANTDIPAPK